MWDTAGEERFRTVANIYLRGAVGALVTYDVTDRASFQSIGTWLEKLNESAPEGLIILLLGNKIDLKD